MSVRQSLGLGGLRLQASEIIDASRAARKAAGLGDDDDPWILPDDGFIDRRAVRLAAQMVRPVKLTPAERLEAATLALMYGATTDEVLRVVSFAPPALLAQREVRYLTPTQSDSPEMRTKREMTHGYDTPEPAGTRPRQREPTEEVASR